MEKFFRSLFGDILSAVLQLALFTLPGKGARHFSSMRAAVLFAAKEAKKSDVYFGVALATHNFGTRNAAQDAGAIGGLWADIDLVAPHRPGKSLPGTIDEVRALLARMPVPPSRLVDSGYGVHAYWLFKEPWIFESENERRKAEGLSKGWHGHLCRLAESMGWALENLGDLARLLRPPGTYNRKNTPPVEVRVLEDFPDRRYNPQDFDQYAAAEETVAPQVVATVGALVLRADAEPPAERFTALCRSCPAFVRSWERQRTDLHDQSQSGYDLSLASIAALDGWSDEEIANLLIAARRKHGEKVAKALRQKYVADTIAKARAAAAERTPDASGVDLSALLAKVKPTNGRQHEPAEKPAAPELRDPGPPPGNLLRVPGLVSELMDHTLATAPYPNVVMAFTGALAMQAFLAGRKVRDPGDNRTNLYLLALAHSAGGKDWPRKVNVRIAHRVGLAGALGDRFASGEGIQDSLFLEPSMLFQTDEFDGLLQAVARAQDGRHEAIMGTLLTMYSAANSIFPVRRKAGMEAAGAIDQPCLVIFGTAIPNHYYGALSERMLTNGFFARMMILESGPRPKGQEACILDLPPRILTTAKWWADFRPCSGNLQSQHPVPAVVEHTDDARRVLTETREQADAEYAKAEERGDPVGTTVWGRVNEQARKLALIHAVSTNHEKPVIDVAAARWATELILHQTRRMLFMAKEHVAENPFHADCLKIIRRLREAPGKELAHSVLLKRMKMDSKAFHDLMETLQQRGDIETRISLGGGRPGRAYRLQEGEE